MRKTIRKMTSKKNSRKIKGGVGKEHILSGMGLTEVPNDINDPTYIETLFLDKNNLTTIPESIGNLIHLKTLNLSHNKFNHIPDTIKLLRNLETLVLSDNQFTTIPETFGELTTVTTLRIENNQITHFPESINTLTHLTRLYLAHNQISSIPEYIGKLTKLTELSLSNNYITSVPESIGELTHLKNLFLDNNKLDSIPDTICNLNNLNILFLNNNSLTNIPTEIGKLQSLTILNISHNQLSSIPNTIGNLKYLRIFLLRHNQLSSIPDEIGKLVQLTQLELTHNQFTTIPDTIGKLKKLMKLELGYNQITRIPNSFGNLNKKLTILNLENNQLTHIPSFKQFYNLKNLNILNNNISTLPTDMNEIPLIKYHINGLSLKDFEFSNNTDKYKKIDGGLYDTSRSPYKIRIETYKDGDDTFEFPIIVLPKGLILYTYSYNADPYNIQSTQITPYHNDLKFFYPIPYYALEIKHVYTTCNACVLTKDIRLIASSIPSPITRQNLVEGLDSIKLKLTKEGYPQINYSYYMSDYVTHCKEYKYDPCISDKIKNGLNVDGYIGIAGQDSLTNKFDLFEQHIDDYNIDTLQKIIGMSLLNSNSITTRADLPVNINSEGKYGIFVHKQNKSIQLKNIDSIFGIPEIVLNLFDNQQFGNYQELLGNKPRPSSKEDISRLNMNFKQLFSCNIDDVEKNISALGDSVVFTRQAPILFHLHRDYIDTSSPYMDYIVDKQSDFSFPKDLVYTNDDGSSFEMMGSRYPQLLETHNPVSAPLRISNNVRIYESDSDDDFSIPSSDVSDGGGKRGGRFLVSAANSLFSKKNESPMLNDVNLHLYKNPLFDNHKPAAEKSTTKSVIQLSETIQGIPVIKFAYPQSGGKTRRRRPVKVAQTRRNRRT